MSEKSFQLFRDYTAAEQKFDYFFAGMLGLTFSYYVSKLEFQKLELNSALVNFIGVGFWVTSLWFSFKRLQTSSLLLQGNMKLSVERENFHRLRRIFEAGGQAISDKGVILTGEEVRTESQKHLKKESKLSENMTSLQNKHLNSYNLRNKFFIGSVILFTSSKAIQYYIK